MEAYLCFGEKRSVIAEVPFILSICKTKRFFTWCQLFLYWQSLETPMLLRAPGCRLQGGLCSVSPLLSGCTTHHCKSTVHLHEQLQPLGLSHMVTAPSCFQQLPMPPWTQPGSPSTASFWKWRQIEHYLFMVSAAWNSTMGRGVAHRKNITQGKQPTRPAPMMKNNRTDGF